MMNDADRSPCTVCVIHLRLLNKLDPRYPCGDCAQRVAYADRNYGMPARLFEDDMYEMHGDRVEIFRMFENGLKISDIAFM